MLPSWLRQGCRCWLRQHIPDATASQHLPSYNADRNWSLINLFHKREGYCRRTPHCRNSCDPHVFFKGEKSWETAPRRSTSRTLKYIRRQYRALFETVGFTCLFPCLNGQCAQGLITCETSVGYRTRLMMTGVGFLPDAPLRGVVQRTPAWGGVRATGSSTRLSFCPLPLQGFSGGE